MDDRYFDLANYELAKSQRALISAKRAFDEGDYDNSANRSYYAIFGMMTAALALKGIQRARHTGIIRAFREEFINSGMLEKKLSKYITDTQNLRDDADYGKRRQYMEGIPREDALDSLHQAEEFISKAQEVICELKKEFVKDKT